MTLTTGAYHQRGEWPAVEAAPGVERRELTCGDQMMVVQFTIQPGAEVPLHTHPHEQIVYMLTGRMDFHIGNEKRAMGPGDVAVIPGGVEHEGFFPEDTEVIDVFAPPREDFLAGEVPAYMRKG